MIGKIQDMVSAAIVVGSTELQQSPSTADTSSVSSYAADGSSYTVDGSGQAQNSKLGAAGSQQQNEDQNDDGKKKDEDKMTEDQVSYMTEELNELMSRINANLEFKYHKEVDTMSVKLVDKKTGKVLSEVPPEDMIKHMIKAKEWLGAFIDENA